MYAFMPRIELGATAKDMVGKKMRNAATSPPPRFCHDAAFSRDEFDDDLIETAERRSADREPAHPV